MIHGALASALKRYPEATAEMIGQATCLVASQAVTCDEDEIRRGVYVIQDYEGLGAATVTQHEGAKLPSCSCVDDPFDESNAACAHVLAVAIYEAIRTPEAPQVIVEPAPAPTVLSGAVMTEAPYSLNVSVEDPDGYQYQLTVRKQESKAFFAAASGLRQWIKAQGFAPVQRGGFTRQAPVQEKSSESPPEQSQEAPGHITTQPNVHTPGVKVYRFHAETLLRSEVGGKYVWAVQGNDIPAYNRKFGMRIWGEVLEAAGFDPVALEEVRSANLPSLHGYVAEYIMKADDDRKPDKVIALTKQG
jgi:hypothetical protein